MAKLVKHKSYKANGEAKIFTYSVVVSKALIKEAGWTGEENVKVSAKNGKIIVEKEG